MTTFNAASEEGHNPSKGSLEIEGKVHCINVECLATIDENDFVDCWISHDQNMRMTLESLFFSFNKHALGQICSINCKSTVDFNFNGFQDIFAIWS